MVTRFRGGTPASMVRRTWLWSMREFRRVHGTDADARPSLPPQRRVTKQIMQEWGRHQIALRNPPTDRMRDVHKLHITQSVPMLDENSALRPNMPQRDDDEGGTPKRLSFCSLAAADFDTGTYVCMYA